MGDEELAAAHTPPVEQMQAGLAFLAALAANERGEHVGDLLDEFCGPGENGFVVGMVSLLNLAGAMLTTVSGEQGTWGFQLDTPFGRVDVGGPTWAARFVTASMNGDHATAFGLWFSAATEEEQEEQARSLSALAVPLLAHATRQFLAAGQVLDLEALQPWEVG